MDRICQALGAAGYDVTLVGRKLKNSLPFTPSQYKGVRLSCWFNNGLLFYSEYNFRLFLFLLFTSFDIICACDLDTALPVRWAAILKRKKSVYDAHEFYTESPELKGRNTVKNIWERIGIMTVPYFTARYTVGERIASLLAEKYHVPFDVIRNISPAATTTTLWKPITARENIILYQGALNIGRGLEIMIDAMRELPGWKLWLAGEGDITAKLQDQVAALGLQDQVAFLGWVKPVDLPGILSQAKINVNLRDAVSLNDYYSLPNKFFDAIHAGLPSINMDFPEYRSICDTYPVSFLISELSVDAIKSIFQRIEIDPLLLVQMSEACKDAAIELNWEHEAQRLRSIYEKLVRNLS